MKCPKCLFDNYEKVKFCEKCGTELELECPNCKAKIPLGKKFCSECGHNLAPPSEPIPTTSSFDHKLDKIQRYLPMGIKDKILAQRDKIEGERKQVSVMFCDMEEFVNMVERLGSEQSYHIMDLVYEILIHKVHEFEGTVNEMTGDGIMALFGAPIALEDAPQRAVSSALSIHREIAKFNDQHKEIGSIRMRIGINTGPVIVGALGNDLRVEFKAVGDTVNLASRIEKLAEAGSTYVSAETFRLTKDIFRFEAIGKKAVKGIENPIRIYKVLSGKGDAYRPRLGSERMIYSEMVGRNKDLDKLELQVMKAINGEGSIVNIIGEAGIGKSRLVAELKNHEVMNRVTLFEGRAISFGENLSFHPIIDIFKQWAQITEDDGEAMALGKLEAAVSRLIPEEFDEVLPFVATLMGMKLSGRYAERIKGIQAEALEKLILKNVRELLIKAAEQTPLVIVTEDLHWADTSSIELLEPLFRLAETHRVLFINIFRPGYRQTGERIIEAVKERLPVYYVEIVLEPLDEGMSEVLINNMLNISGLHHDIIRQVIQRTGGNPFFIEEVVRSFIDEGAVVIKNGLFEVTDKIHKIAIPYTINDVLMARIDRLEEETRNLVKVASIIGRNFFHRVISDVEGAVKDIDRRLSYLKEMQLIRERKSGGETEYFFKHALAQEAAYASILLQKRKALHLKVADSIKKVFSKRLHEFYGVLSYHYSNGEDLNKAEEYMLKAGEEAMKSSASSEALHYYQRAMDLYISKRGDAVDSKKIAELEENIATAFFNKGYFVEAVDYFKRSIINQGVKVRENKILLLIKLIFNLSCIIRFLYFPQIRKKKIPSNLDNQIMTKKLKMGLALAYVDIKRVFIDNIELVKQAFKYDVSKSQVYFNVLAGSSSLFAVTGISFSISKKLLDYAQKSILNKDEKASFSLHFYKFIESVHNSLSGNWYEELDEDLVDYALRIGDVSSASGCLVWLGYVKIELGEFEKSEIIIEKLKNIGDIYNFIHAKLDFYYLTAKLLMKKRESNKAAKYADEGIILLNKIGLDMRKIEFLGLKTRIFILQNEVNTAEKIIEEAKNLVLKVGKRAVLTNYYSDYLMGIFSYNLARLENAIASNVKQNISKYKRAALEYGKLATKHCRKKVAADRTEAFNLMGRYYWLINNQAKALMWWNNSIKEAERLKAKPELSRTYFEIGKQLNEKKSQYKELNGIKAKEYLNMARIMFEELDLKRDLEKLDRINTYK
ncbi:MAG: adenylate/guanylate cyclase domain-containing protein [Desulfobacterales bacterium]|jgi:class 3 adenylate cyclase